MSQALVVEVLIGVFFVLGLTVGFLAVIALSAVRRASRANRGGHEGYGFDGAGGSGRREEPDEADGREDATYRGPPDWPWRR